MVMSFRYNMLSEEDEDHYEDDQANATTHLTNFFVAI